MRYPFYLIFVLMLVIITSCKQHINQATPAVWSTLTIVSEENEIITIENNEDTSMVKSYDGGSIFTGRHKVIVDSLKAYFTTAEKDTLYSLMKDIITAPAKPKIACTDFAGDLKLIIDYNSFKEPGSLRQSVEYTGVCKWDSLSDKTIHLHSILKRRIKWWSK